jgi:pilus assembly protein Flp/PilA
MIKFLKSATRFVKDESGAAIVEYGLALLVVGAIGTAAFTGLGTQTNTNVQAACTAIGATC